MKGDDRLIGAYEMIIDGIPISEYGYMIARLGNGVEDGMGTLEENVTIQNPLTSDVRLVKSGEKEVLKFKVSLAKSNSDALTIDANDRDLLDFWLTSKEGFRRIEFEQEDYKGIYYMGRINNIIWKNVANRIVSCEFEVETDSPYAHRSDECIVIDTSVNKTFAIENPTHGDRWNYPVVKITMGSSGSDISIKNVTDKNRTFSLTGLVANEVIEVECKSGRIKSSTDLNRVQQCNLKYPRLAYGTNTFVVDGNVSSIEFTYKNDVRVGA